MSDKKTGWLRLYRSISEKGYYCDSQAIHLWVHILLKANYKKREIMWNGEIVILEAGSFITGRKKLSAETGISESKIYRLLKLFEKEEQIEQQTNNKSSIITITNYSKLQSSEQQMNNKRTTDEQPVNTDNTLKELNNSRIKDIVAFLNTSTDRDFRHSTATTQRCIVARLNDGYTVDDFTLVIKSKASEWLNTEHAKYLRPETLFGNKFEGYLQEAKNPGKKKGKIDVYKNKGESQYSNLTTTKRDA